MANPQKENGYTAIANEIMDFLCRYRIPGESRQVLDCILRMTYGWNRKKAEIQNKSICEMTGLKSPNVTRAVSWLVKNKIVFVIKNDNENGFVIKNDNKRAKVLKFNKDYSQWVPHERKNFVIKNDNDSLSKTITNVIKNDNETDFTPFIYKTNKTNKTMQDFLIFWEKYPVKKSKKEAEKLWDKLKKRGELPPINEIIDSINRQIDEKEHLKRSNRFCPEWKHPTTWLNQGCWEDDCDLSEKTKKGGVDEWIKSVSQS